MLNVLRQNGIAVHPPVLQSGYDWCGGTPFDIQKTTVELLTENPRAYVLSSMGTGKTKCVCWAFDYLQRYKAATKMLVVAPLSTLHFVWGREIFRTTPHLKYAVLHGSVEKRREMLADPTIDIYIINHDGLGLLLHDIVARTDIDVLCIDELAVYRNKSHRTMIAEHASRSKQTVWGLTGEPTPNAPTDAFHLARIVTPHTVPKYFSHFRDQTMLRINQFKWVAKRDANDVVLRALRPNVRFTLDDVTELPPFVSRQQQVKLGTKQEKVYKQIKDMAYAMLQNGEIKAANAGAVMVKLLQISLGWVYLNDGSAVQLDGTDRITALTDIIDAAERKVIVFAPYKHALGGIVDAITGKGKTAERVDGDTPLAERTRIFQAFTTQAHPEVLVAHPQCVAHGVTLTEADTIIWFGPITSSEIYSQANARIRRIGQRFKQLFLHLWATPVERHVYNLLSRKIIQQDDLLKMLEELTQEST